MQNNQIFKFLDEKSFGLMPVIVQDIITKDVLMLGFCNLEAYEITTRTKRATFYSRSRDEIWTKGDTSGAYQIVDKILIDCDNDTLIYLVNSDKPACHTGSRSCFRELDSL